MLLIGSHALRYHLPDMPANGRFKDFDLISSYEEYDLWVKSLTNVRECYPIDSGKKMVVKTESNDIFEVEIAWPGSTGESLIAMVAKTRPLLFHKTNPTVPIHYIPDLNTLYTIKMSHRFLKNSPHFLKTMKDLWLMKTKGAVIPEDMKGWLKEREKATYTYAHPKLNQGKEGFFDKNQGVTYVYDHDSIHRAMAHLEMPAYEYYKGDTAEVFCDRKKFDALPELTKLYGVLEEAYVLALERSQVPFQGKVPTDWSFFKALEKVCTSITSGWFRAYAYNNYDAVVDLYKQNYPGWYVDKFWDGVEKGVVVKL